VLRVQEPTAAATEREVQALVVSQETIPGANSINEYRASKGFPPLQLVIVNLVGLQAASGAKLSSTRLREEDAQR
jgi:pantetheine-phosphate adenylyltransferase